MNTGDGAVQRSGTSHPQHPQLRQSPQSRSTARKKSKGRERHASTPIDNEEKSRWDGGEGDQRWLRSVRFHTSPRGRPRVREQLLEGEERLLLQSLHVGVGQ